MASIDRERLASAMKKAGFSQAELARRASVSPAAVQQMLNGKIKSSRSIREIADALEVSDQWLQGLTDDPIPYIVISKNPSDAETSRLPYSLAENGQRKLKFLTLSSFWLNEIAGTDNPFGHVMSVVFDGAMAPTLMPGDNMLMRVSNVFDGAPNSIWMIRLKGRTLLRRVREKADDVFVLSADNPVVPAIEVGPSDFELHGEVIWQGRKLNP